MKEMEEKKIKTRDKKALKRIQNDVPPQNLAFWNPVILVQMKRILAAQNLSVETKAAPKVHSSVFTAAGPPILTTIDKSEAYYYIIFTCPTAFLLLCE